MRCRTIDGVAVFAVLMLVGAISVADSRDTIWYVDDDAPLGGDGLAWSSAFFDLQSALEVAAPGDTVRIAGGLYVPTTQVDPNDPNDPRARTFVLWPGVTWLGGYAGLSGDGDPNERDVQQYETILTGDLLGDDLPDFANRDDNAYHVITGRDIDARAVIDGVTITAGHAENIADLAGGSAVLLIDSDVTLRDCTIVDNASTDASSYGEAWAPVYVDSGKPLVIACRFFENRVSAHYAHGGGIYLRRCSPHVEHCTFVGNTATAGGGISLTTVQDAVITRCLFHGHEMGWGGGISFSGVTFETQASDLVIDRSVFIGNHAAVRGGAVYFNTNGATIQCVVSNCTFSGNDCVRGGAIYVGGGAHDDPSITDSIYHIQNCVFVGNSAEYGGALYSWRGAPLLTNCTFRACSAPNGALLACETYPNTSASEARFVNCIIWNGGDEVWNQDGSTISIDHSVITPAWPGEGNIDADPLMAFELTGSWTGKATYDENTHCVTYYTDLGAFTAGALAGAFLNPDVTQPREFLIVSNDESTVTTYVDYTLYADDLVGGDSGRSYRIRDYRLPAGSPCIDAGNNAAVASDMLDLDDDGNWDERLPLDFAGYWRFRNDPATADTGFGAPPIVDMGAYEYQPPICGGDCDCDGQISLGDINPFVDALISVADYYAANPQCDHYRADIDDDGAVRFADINAFIDLITHNDLPVACP